MAQERAWFRNEFGLETSLVQERVWLGNEFGLGTNLARERVCSKMTLFLNEMCLDCKRARNEFVWTNFVWNDLARNENFRGMKWMGTSLF